MENCPRLEILPQPDLTTCGPTCLHSIYSYYGDDIGLDEVVSDVAKLKTGGTLDVFLAYHALRRGYRATIYTYNLKVFDPTWFQIKGIDFQDRLRAQLEFKNGRKIRVATRGYLDFFDLGGEIRFEDLTAGLIERYLDRSIPILTGLSSTYLYRCKREYGIDQEYDDIRGDPSGHFVVLCGFDKATGNVLVADPINPNPLADDHYYMVKVERVICAILLGILTYDANLLIIEPRS
jgi:hypothetical protein